MGELIAFASLAVAVYQIVSAKFRGDQHIVNDLLSATSAAVAKTRAHLADVEVQQLAGPQFVPARDRADIAEAWNRVREILQKVSRDDHDMEEEVAVLTKRLSGKAEFWVDPAAWERQGGVPEGNAEERERLDISLETLHKDLKRLAGSRRGGRP